MSRPLHPMPEQGPECCTQLFPSCMVIREVIILFNPPGQQHLVSSVQIKEEVDKITAGDIPLITGQRTELCPKVRSKRLWPDQFNEI